ncbi:MAG: thioredoxin domain-containing protein [Candidatus Limivicinus sp.]|jgi:uncharacterized protein YyaL (SSP411 family)
MSNSLINEKSPYLLEHAENPVDWFPWGETAFKKAREEDRPIFLSIGYSTCHWCHVMARESFENQAVADILNRNFVSVKVDREERPDVDAVYMRVCTALNGSGGWPMTIIMTPEGKPFFASTYIPRENRGRSVGLISLLKAVALKWQTDRAELVRSAGELTSFVSKEKNVSPAPLTEDFLKAAAGQLADSYDSEYGGFGRAPKFPAPQNLIFLLRYSALSGDKKAEEEVEGTLRAMYKGGIYDHFGGGFSRYSTDREWLAPHFEKTLYDNALLAYTYTEAWAKKRMAMYRDVAEATLDYCMRELLSPEGGYYCGQDADSGGEEGAYYLFTPPEVKAQLGEDAGRHFCECYDITEEGNFHGKSIPNILLNTRWNLLPEGYDDFREELRIYRAKRMSLRTDKKILTSWNGLMLMALSKAAAVFDDPRYLNAAAELADFIRDNMFAEGKLKGRLCGGELRFSAQLDDYAFYALGLLELYRADYDPQHIIDASSLAAEIASRFSDGRGGLYRTAEDSEKLIFRPREVFDGAMPSGSSAAAVLFDELFRYTADIEMRELRDRLLGFICGSCGKYPAGSPFALCALLSAVYPTRELLCAAPVEDRPELLKTISSRYMPELSILLKSPGREKALAAAAPFTASAAPRGDRPCFYLCEDGCCREGMSL